MRKKNILICIDRDGTIIYDKKYHLGSQKNWRSLVKILPYVIRGLKLLNTELPDAKIYLVTNQPGVAVRNMPLLNMKRAKEVCRYILSEFSLKGAVFKGYNVCGYASKAYTQKKPYFIFDKKMVKEHPCIKPRPGMIKEIMKKGKMTSRNTEIYVVGDRKSDVEVAHNIGGFGILVPFKNRPGEDKLVKKIRNKNKYIAKNFLDACRFIIRRENESNSKR